MQPLNEHIQGFLRHKKNPSSQRAHLVQQICDTLFDDAQFKKILGQTSAFTVPELRAIFDEARSWKVNSPALFWKLVREKQAAIKEQLSEEYSES